MNYIVVALGGAAGALARYQTSLLFQQTGLQLPYATLFVNVSGSIFFAAVLFLLGEKMAVSEQLRLLLLVGFAGAFTTFSTFSYEIVSLFQSGLYVMALLFIVANLVLSLCAFALTFYLATKFFV